MTLDAWDVYGDLSSREPSTLNDEQRALIAVCDLRQEVNAGGFDNYFSAWGGNSAPDALAALSSLIGSEWSDLLRSAMNLFGAAYPEDPDERSNTIDAAGLGDALGALNERFYELEGSTDADALLNAHVNASPETWS